MTTGVIVGSITMLVIVGMVAIAAKTITTMSNNARIRREENI